MKIILGYSYFSSNAYEDIEQTVFSYINQLRSYGYDIEPFCLTLNPPGPCLNFAELDKRWSIGDKELLMMYERLEYAVENADVFINASGINLHPEFVEKLPVFTAFQCFDDPESSEWLSRPVAYAYDIALVGNIAEIDNYKKWGVENVVWSPMGLQPQIYDSSLTYDDILYGKRDIDLLMMIDKISPYRKQRLEKIEKEFPNAHFYGNGWKRGFLANEKQLEYLRRSKIGPNIHNSTGPINFRTFYLPANGVMQICDNKSFLGKIYKLNEEVVGFDTIEECIELCHFYLQNDDERRRIAANGWRRVMRDYTQEAVFERTISEIEKHLYSKRDNKNINTPIVVSYKKRRMHFCWNKVKFALKGSGESCKILIQKTIRKIFLFVRL